MKILIPTLMFAPAGGYRVLAELANQWIKEGHNVDFLVNEASSMPYFPTNAKIKWATNLGKLVDENERSERSPRTFNGWINLFSLYRVINKIGKDYDVILANHSLTAWPVAFAKCGLANKFYYIQAYEPEYYSLERKLKSKVLQWLSTKSYDFNLIQICNAPIYFEYKNIRAKEWVPPGIDFDLFYPKKVQKYLANASEIVLGCIGRKETTKGIKYVLEAFVMLYAQDQRYRLHVAFGNLPDNWTHPGLQIFIPQSDRELADYYRTLDIMIAPGIVQLGAPHYPVMEAMACGVPVITTGYLPADHENSWIVEVGSSASIVDAVKDITSNSELSKKTVKASMDIKPFGWKPVSNKMMKYMIDARLP